MKRRFFIPLAGLLSICVLGGCGETKGSIPAMTSGKHFGICCKIRVDRVVYRV